MATKKFQPVKHPGAATAAAERAGLSLEQWSRKHYNDPGRTGKRARFVQIRKGWRSAGRNRKRSGRR